MKSLLTSAQHARIATIRSIPRTALVPEGGRHNPDFDKVETGCVVAFEGGTYRVASVSRYEETSWNFKKDTRYRVFEWELFHLETGETRYLEWERDDTVEVWLSEHKLDANSDTYGAKSWKQFLDDERLDANLTISANGVSYRYDDEESWAAKFYRDYRAGDGEAHFARFYEFSEIGGKGCLTVESWGKDGSDGVEVWTSREIHPASVTLLATKS